MAMKRWRLVIRYTDGSVLAEWPFFFRHRAVREGLAVSGPLTSYEVKPWRP